MGSQFFLLSLADIFSIYPKIFQDLLRAEEEKRNAEGALAKDFLYLPSDYAWQEKVYYRLLEVQKRVNLAIESGLAPEDVDKKSDKPVWSASDVLQIFSPRSSPAERIFAERRKCVTEHPIEYIDIRVLGCWTLENIAKAGKLLRKPPTPVTFNDEHEMRKVYSLIYDVFRYKHVLIQALIDVNFFALYSELKADENRVWLMLFELHARHFLRRPAEEVELQNRLYEEAELENIAKCLWAQRIRLAASISRLRIKNGALNLAQLLPVHLQDEKVAIAAANPIVSGWMNPFKLKDKIVAQEYLERMGMSEVNENELKDDEKTLKVNQYKWDKICPLFLTLLPQDRGEFARSDLVRNNIFIMQDRTFSVAPAILSKMLDHFQLDGDIVQTHVSSPRSTAYLAALFYSVNRVNDFIAFGAGQNLKEYKEYISLLGVNNIRLYPQNFCSLSLESQILETVVGIFATPPNSFSGVADPIDLICSRGGDLSMLEVLTESEISSDGRKRVAQILEEQRETLRLSMSRPQVQFILYETHSIVGSENQDMVQRAVEDINRCAFEKHLIVYKEKKRLQAIAEAESAAIPSMAGGASHKKGGDSTTKTDDKVRLAKSASKESDLSNVEPEEEDYTLSVKVPETDEFIISNVPDMCTNQDQCLDVSALGCYVALINRKQITKLDAKYLIKMAEARGLFGSGEKKKSAKPKSMKKVEKKPEKKDNDMTTKRRFLKKSDIASLIERLNTPTRSSFIRSNVKTISSISDKSISFDFLKKACSRHSKHHGEDPYHYSTSSAYMSSLHLDSRAKRWWREATDYVNDLQNMRDISNNLKTGQILPPLSLTRSPPDYYQPYHISKKKEPQRVPYPVFVSKLEFKGNGVFDLLRTPRPSLGPDTFSVNNVVQRAAPSSPKPLGLLPKRRQKTS